jgi:hypothetical protein
MSWSQSPPANSGNKPQAKTAASKQEPKHDQRGTEASPLVIKALKTDDETDKERHYREQEAATNVRLVYFTGGLLLVALLQFVAMLRQEKWMRRSVEIAGDTALAAKGSADAYRVSERAWMAWVRVHSANFENAVDADTGEQWGDGTMFSIEWVNAGRTPAIRCGLYSVGKAVPDGNPVPAFTPAPDDGQRQAPLIPGVKVESPRCHFRKKEMEAWRNGKNRIFLYGRADYDLIYPGEDRKRTEVCIEVGYGGIDSKTQAVVFTFTAMGPQNTAT